MTKRIVSITDTPEMSKQARYYHRERWKILEALGFRCEECGGYMDLEIHHLNGHDLPIGRPLAARIRDWHEQLKAGNLILLCRECHEKANEGSYIDVMDWETEHINRMR